MKTICLFLFIAVLTFPTDGSSESSSDSDSIESKSKKKSKATALAQTLELMPHPEGGYYKETYASPIMVTLPNGNVRTVATSIYYLLESGDFSQWHRLTADELWYFHSGTSLTVYEIDAAGAFTKTVVGDPIKERSAVPQYLVKAGNWFAAGVNRKKSYCLVGCVVAPGFDFADFEMGTLESLTKLYPQHTEIIKKFIH